MRIEVRVKPGSSRESVEQNPDGTLTVRVHAKPQGGEANDAVARAVAEHMGVARSRVRVVTPKGRQKIVEIS